MQPSDAQSTGTLPPDVPVDIAADHAGARAQAAARAALARGAMAVTVVDALIQATRATAKSPGALQAAGAPHDARRFAALCTALRNGTIPEACLSAIIALLVDPDVSGWAARSYVQIGRYLAKYRFEHRHERTLLDLVATVASEQVHWRDQIEHNANERYHQTDAVALRRVMLAADKLIDRLGRLECDDNGSALKPPGLNGFPKLRAAHS
jgi:hypothetical protein